MFHKRKHNIYTDHIISIPRSSFFSFFTVTHYLLLLLFWVGFFSAAFFDLLPGKPASPDLKIFAGFIFVTGLVIIAILSCKIKDLLEIKKIYKSKGLLCIESKFLFLSDVISYQWKEVSYITFAYQNRFKPYDLLVMVNEEPKIVDISLDKRTVNKAIDIIELWFNKKTKR